MKTFDQFVQEMALGTVKYNMPGVKALASQKLNDKFAKVLERHADFTFNFLFRPYNMTAAYIPDERKMYEDDVHAQGINTAGAITVVLTRAEEKVQQLSFGSTKATIMPLTPWTRIHRACHGFIDNSGGYLSGRYANDQRWAYEEMEHAIRHASHLLHHAGYLFDFKSAKDAHGSGASIRIELYREILTDYIWNGGKVRVSEYGEKLFPGLTENLVEGCHAILSRFVGKILIEQMDFV